MAGADNILNKLSGGQKVLAVEAEASVTGTFVFRFVHLQRQGQSLSVTDSGHGYESVAELKKAAKNTPPVALVITGKRVLYKQLMGKLEDSVALTQSVLPNATPNDFYEQHTIGQDPTLAAVIRRQHLDDLLEEMSLEGLLVQEVFLGPHVLAQAGLLVGNHDHWEHLRYDLGFKDGRVSHFKTLKEPQATPNFKVGDTTLDPENVLAFTAGLAVLSPFIDFSTPESELLGVQQGEIIQRSRFRSIGWTVLVVFFVALLANYLLHEKYTEELGGLQAKEQLHRTQINRIEELQSELDNKQSLLQASGVLSGGSMAYYSDQIAATVPDEIQLTNLDVSPPSEAIKKDHRIAYQTRRIVVHGETDRSSTVNAWANTLNGLDWVASVNLVNYERDDRRSVAIFELILELP